MNQSQPAAFLHISPGALRLSLASTLVAGSEMHNAVHKPTQRGSGLHALVRAHTAAPRLADIELRQPTFQLQNGAAEGRNVKVLRASPPP
jgi:hypothetical protein